MKVFTLTIHSETAADENPDVYFPIRDRIADGYFESTTSDHDLYHRFLKLLDEDQLLVESESLSSFKLALSIRNSAPRIEAHYQFYNTSIQPALGENRCETWLEVQGKQYCDPTTDKEDGKLSSSTVSQILPFDRVLNPGSGILVTLYTDITSKDFSKFHKIAAEAAKKGKSAYRIRYKPVDESLGNPLVMSGYGVELALKRTDYIVIDDRKKDDDSSESTPSSKPTEGELEDQDVDDMKPLARSEVKDLAMKAAHYALASDNPLETLLKITQDFPKHSASLAQHVVTDEFNEEFIANRETFLPTGASVIWINGAQYDPRKVDAFSLLDHLRRERKLINGFKSMGLSAGEAITLLSNPALMEAYAKGQKDVQRYDWRDEKEGGEVILWLNNIEKDKRYSDWPTDVQSVRY
jgi:UDP-glucose:glycoprotein glucosyltransferase